MEFHHLSFAALYVKDRFMMYPKGHLMSMVFSAYRGTIDTIQLSVQSLKFNHNSGETQGCIAAVPRKKDHIPNTATSGIWLHKKQPPQL
jgi:hypothetical protein